MLGKNIKYFDSMSSIFVFLESSTLLIFLYTNFFKNQVQNDFFSNFFLFIFVKTKKEHLQIVNSFTTSILIHNYGKNYDEQTYKRF